MSICLSDTAVTSTSLGGHLRLECSTRADGSPYISKQDFRAPVHIGKSHLDQGALVLNIANPTAGFFDGDRVEIDVSVAAGARLCLSTPAASRVYPTRSGKHAACHQTFRVGENACFEWNPEAFIPHAGASYLQTTRIELHPTASLLYFEWLAPGRVAKGEAFAFQKLRWEFDLAVGENLVARERFDLTPENHSLASLLTVFPAAHYLSVYAAGRLTVDWPADELDSMNTDDARLGHGPLQHGVHVIRALCRDSVAARGVLGNLRGLLHSRAGLIPPALGRIFS